MWLSYQPATYLFAISRPTSVIGTWSLVITPPILTESSPKKVCNSCICMYMYNTRPLPNHKQSIHPPALPSYLYSYLPAVWKLFNRPPTPTLVPIPSFPTHPQDSSAPLKKNYSNPLPPSWQPNTLTPLTPPYRMVEEVSANLELSIAQRWLTSNNRCGKCAPR